MLAWKGVVAGVCVLAFFILERLIPIAPRPETAGLARLARNAGLWVANIPLSVFIVVPLTAFAAQWDWDWGWGWGLTKDAGAAGLVIDLLLLDLFLYWWHRANHTWGVLWRFHRVHHLDEFLDVSSSVRFHFGEVALSALARAAFIVVLDIPLTSVLVFETLVLIASAFHHSNIRLPTALEKTLSFAIVTPGIHWVHHHPEGRDLNANYATVLSVWDRLFFSRSPTVRTPSMPIGLPCDPDRRFLGLLLAPFAARVATSGRDCEKSEKE